MVNVPPVRIYGEVGCPFCEQAIQFFQRNGIPIQGIALDEDPIIREGIKVVSKQSEVKIPVVVSFLNPKEVILGYSEDGYKRIVETYRAFVSASAGDFSVSVGAAPPAPPPVAQSEEPVNKEIN